MAETRPQSHRRGSAARLQLRRRAPLRHAARGETGRRGPRQSGSARARSRGNAIRCRSGIRALYELIPADQLDIRGSFVDEREIKAGLGAPLVAKRVADQVHEYAPTPHFYYTATAVARFEGSRCVLALEDPLESETVRVGRRTFPLAADFTAPLAMMLVEMHPKQLDSRACCTRRSSPPPPASRGSSPSIQTRPSCSSSTV